MRCSFCDNPFFATRKDAEFCSAKCRAAAYRRRLRPLQSLASEAPEPQSFDLSAEEDSRRASERRLQRDPALRAASGQGTSLREPLELQVLRQVPPQACGYRLLYRMDHVPATFDTVPSHRSWRVTPFEPPNDDRLVPDTHYRILWFDAQDRELPALPNTPLPCLYLFLGLPDADAAARSHETLRHLQVVAELKQRVQKLEAELANTKVELQLSQRKVRGLRKRMVRRVRALRRKHRQEVSQKADNELLKLLGAFVAGGVGIPGLISLLKGLATRLPSPNSETARNSAQPMVPQAASKPAQAPVTSKPSEPQLSSTSPQAPALPNPAPLPAKWRQAQDVLAAIASQRASHPAWSLLPTPAKQESRQALSQPDLERGLAQGPAGQDAAATPSSRWELRQDRAALGSDDDEGDDDDDEGDDDEGDDGEPLDPRRAQGLATILASLDESKLATFTDPDSLRQYLSAKLNELQAWTSAASTFDSGPRSLPPAGTDPGGSSSR